MDKRLISIRKKHTTSTGVRHQAKVKKHIHSNCLTTHIRQLIIILLATIQWGGGGKICSYATTICNFYTADQVTAHNKLLLSTIPLIPSKEEQEKASDKELSNSKGSPNGIVPQRFHNTASSPKTSPFSWYKTWWAGLLYACVLISPIFFIYLFHYRKQQKESIQKGYPPQSTITNTSDITTSHTEKRECQKTTNQNILQGTYNTEERDIDHPTIEKAINTVKENLASKDFDVKQFAYEMCMSTSTLYRKIKTATGLSPVEFVRIIRLKEAYRMLTESDMSVSEIAIACGFSTLWYFSKCFKIEFGILPTDLKKMKSPPKSISQSRKVLDKLLNET